MKYVDVQVTFSEVPNEISLCIDISGCNIHCPDCHSRYLWKDIGKELTKKELLQLVNTNSGISCICILGGTESELISLITSSKEFLKNYKIAWYTGKKLTEVDTSVLSVLDYIKTGPYDSNCGGLRERTTNQKFYRVTDGHISEDLTSMFWTSVEL